MARRSKAQRLLWYAAAALCAAGALGWLWSIAIWYQYWDLPRSANPATGNVYALNIHGVVVYQTLAEQIRRQRWEFWSMAVAICGASLGAIQRWISREKASE